MILTKEQAQAIYSAMCALNSIGAKLNSSLYERAQLIRVHETGGFIRVEVGGLQHEVFESQSAFATAYELLEPSLSHLDALETIASGNTDPDRMVEIAKEAIASAEGIKKCPGVSDSQCGWSKTTGAGDTCKVCGEIFPF